MTGEGQLTRLTARVCGAWDACEELRLLLLARPELAPGFANADETGRGPLNALSSYSGLVPPLAVLIIQP
jgi:hypothetical protein